MKMPPFATFHTVAALLIGLALITSPTSASQDEADTEVEINFGDCTASGFTYGSPAVLAFDCSSVPCNILTACPDPSSTIDYYGGTCDTGGTAICVTYTNSGSAYIYKDCVCLATPSNPIFPCNSGGLKRGGNQTFPVCDGF